MDKSKTPEWHQDISETQLRCWCVDYAMQCNGKRPQKAEKAIKAAEMFYGFVTRKSADIKNIGDTNTMSCKKGKKRK